MKSTVYRLLGLSALVFPIAVAAAAPVLDKPYGRLIHPVPDSRPYGREETAPELSRSDVLAAVQMQTPVKDQSERGTCSIFSATALLESLLIQSGRAGRDIDLSEQWLQYLTTLQTGEEGSTSPANFTLLAKYGQPSEARLPYEPEEWTSKREGLPHRRCGHLPRGWQLKACLVSHRDPALMNAKDEVLADPASSLYDPEFAQARREAFANRDGLLARLRSDGAILTSVSEIKRSLVQGTPLALDLDFYYGSWNFPGSNKLKINRSRKLWKKGVVTFPEPDSADLTYSKKDPGGHSVVVVGFDDEVMVEYKVRMKDGRMRTFKRKGVYYFKNSWGTEDFGSEFEVNGRKLPGYGMILQDHAHTYGQFFRLEI